MDAAVSIKPDSGPFYAREVESLTPFVTHPSSAMYFAKRESTQGHNGT